MLTERARRSAEARSGRMVCSRWTCCVGLRERVGSGGSCSSASDVVRGLSGTARRARRWPSEDRRKARGCEMRECEASQGAPVRRAEGGEGSGAHGSEEVTRERERERGAKEREQRSHAEAEDRVRRRGARRGPSRCVRQLRLAQRTCDAGPGPETSTLRCRCSGQVQGELTSSVSRPPEPREDRSAGAVQRALRRGAAPRRYQVSAARCACSALVPCRRPAR
jgi:hypothetical protein